MAQVGLELHPDKTRIVYCKDDDRRRLIMSTSGSTFLGYTFRPRLSKSKYGKHFVNFSPAVSDDAAQGDQPGDPLLAASPGAVTRPSSDLARMFNPIVQGWINYYGRFYKSRLYPVLTTHQRLSRSLGHDGSTSGCTATPGGRRTWLASVARRASAPLRPLASWACGPTAGRWEPDERRRSRPVLREPGGEIPPGHSPRSAVQDRRSKPSRLEERQPPSWVSLAGPAPGPYARKSHVRIERRMGERACFSGTAPLTTNEQPGSGSPCRPRDEVPAG